MHFLSQKIEFPDVTEASEDGLLAVGGDLSTESLIYAYSKGIFPWFNDAEPILWWSPDPRFVLFTDDLKVSKSMKQFLRNTNLKVTFNLAFEAVITACANSKRADQIGTWITDEMKTAYIKLHQLGYAKSVEVWQNKILVGGLYGVDLGYGVFSGESMFTKVSNASKLAFITFIKTFNYQLIDCQLHTPHLESLGGKHISRKAFLKYL